MEELFAIAVPFVKSVALAIVTLVVGLFIIKKISLIIKRWIDNTKLDSGLKPFLVSLISGLLKILLIISVVEILGVDTTSFVAVLAAAGFAVGLAFQGSLSNFAGGVLLLTLRPFSVGDYIEANGYSGTVGAIQILYTELITVDNKVIYIPNGNLSNTGIVNYSRKDTRRVDFTFGVGYEADIDQVAGILKEIVESHDLILQDPEPFVRLAEHGDSAVGFVVRVWVKASDYWTVHFDVMETVKKRFDAEKISIPYPQMDVHITQS